MRNDRTAVRLGRSGNGIDFYAQSYAIGLGNMMMSASPDLVAVGGGVANMGDVLLVPGQPAAQIWINNL